MCRHQRRTWPIEGCFNGGNSRAFIKSIKDILGMQRCLRRNSNYNPNFFLEIHFLSNVTIVGFKMFKLFDQRTPKENYNMYHCTPCNLFLKKKNTIVVQKSETKNNSLSLNSNRI